MNLLRRNLPLAKESLSPLSSLSQDIARFGFAAEVFTHGARLCKKHPEFIRHPQRLLHFYSQKLGLPLDEENQMTALFERALELSQKDGENPRFPVSIVIPIVRVSTKKAYAQNCPLPPTLSFRLVQVAKETLVSQQHPINLAVVPFLFAPSRLYSPEVASEIYRAFRQESSAVTTAEQFAEPPSCTPFFAELKCLSFALQAQPGLPFFRWEDEDNPLTREASLKAFFEKIERLLNTDKPNLRHHCFSEFTLEQAKKFALEKNVFFTFMDVINTTLPDFYKGNPDHFTLLIETEPSKHWIYLHLLDQTNEKKICSHSVLADEIEALGVNLSEVFSPIFCHIRELSKPAQ